MKKKIIVVALTITLSFSMIGSVVSQEITPEQLMIQIQQLQQVVAQLYQNYTASMTEKPTACTTTTSFTRNLSLGSKGVDVKCLQALLNASADTQIATSGIGSKGQETEHFGPLTRTAVIRFQNKYASEILALVGLTAGTGFVGPSTRTKLNAMLKVTPVSPIDPPVDPKLPVIGPTYPTENEYLKKLNEIITALAAISEKIKALEEKDDEEKEPFGKIRCPSSTEDTITVSYETENTTSASLFRGNTRVVVVGTGKNSGTYTVRNLSPGTEYTFYLRNGLLSTSKEIDRIKCVTRREEMSIDIKETEDKFIFTLKVSEDINLPQSGRWDQYYPEIYKYESGKWKKLLLSSECIGRWCHIPCHEKPLAEIACSPIPHPPICEKISSEYVFLWHKEYYLPYWDSNTETRVCDNKKEPCSTIFSAEPGKYKIVFSYKTDSCPKDEKFNVNVFKNNIKTIEREFSVEPIDGFGVLLYRSYSVPEEVFNPKKGNKIKLDLFESESYNCVIGDVNIFRDDFSFICQIGQIGSAIFSVSDRKVLGVIKLPGKWGDINHIIRYDNSLKGYYLEQVRSEWLPD